MAIKRIKRGITGASNYVKSIPTRLKAREEYRNDTYSYEKIGNDLHRTKRKTPLKTYNKASTGIR
jgi:hypothetical protein